MLFKDITTQEKQSLSTIPSSTQICTCTPFLKQKLFEILEALQEDIFSKEQELKQIKISYLQNIIEKQEIIERLVSANSMLIVDNQVLAKRVLEERKQFQRRSEIMKARIHEYQIIMEYLQKNRKQVKLRNKYCNTLHRKQSQSIKKFILSNQPNSKTPSKRESNSNEVLDSPKISLTSKYKFLNENKMIGRNVNLCEYYGTVRTSNNQNQYRRQVDSQCFEGVTEDFYQ